MGKLKSELRLFSKAQLSAMTATLTDFTVSLLGATLLGGWYVWSSLAGATAGGVVNCVVNYRWVFCSQHQKKKYVAVKYALVWMGSIALNTLCTYALTELTRQHFILAKAVVSVAVALLWNYQLQKCFVYQNRHIVERIKKKMNRNEL